MPSFFRHASSYRNALGFVALATMAALVSPGVRVARAEDGAAMSVTRTPLPFTGPDGLPLEDAGSCQIGDEGRNLPGAGQVAQALDQLAKAAPADSVVFDGTGHNYKSDNDVLAEIRRIREEIRRDQAQPEPHDQAAPTP